MNNYLFRLKIPQKEHFIANIEKHPTPQPHTFALYKKTKQYMKRSILTSLLISVVQALSAQSLEDCQALAEQNYPLIKRYDLISQSTDYNLNNVSKNWLPQITAYAQASLQNKVTEWPDAFKSMLQQMGTDMEGLKKYKAQLGIDINQTLYDGGQTRLQKQVVQQEGEIKKAETESDIYKIRQQINELYFSALLIEDRLKLNDDLQKLLASNEKKVADLQKGGIASERDLNYIKAERLAANQQRTELESQKETISRLLALFCGQEISNFSLPNVSLSDDSAENNRPELRQIDAQIKLYDAQEDMLNAKIRPRISFFASGYFGYPGYNMFEDIMEHSWSVNGTFGARISWDIGQFYTRKNDKSLLSLNRQMAENQRETFLFSNNMEQEQVNANISRYKKLIQDDEQLISLRADIRKSTESQLDHGIIDINDLIKEINSENAAKLQLSTHQIEMAKEIADLKYITNK